MSILNYGGENSQELSAPRLKKMDKLNIKRQNCLMNSSRERKSQDDVIPGLENAEKP